MAVAAAWANGNRPTYTQGDRWILRLDGNRYATLANGPNLTAEGRYARDNLGWNEPDLSLDIFHVLDETREWKISEQTYDPATGQTVVTLNRTLQGVPMLWGNLLHPHLIMEESLMDTNGRCVFVALAKYMDEPEDIIEAQLEEVFDELYDRKEEPWNNRHFTQVGVTPNMIIRFCEKRKMGCVVLHGSVAYKRIENDRHHKTLAFVFWSGHCYIYESAKILDKNKRLRRHETRTTEPPDVTRKCKKNKQETQAQRV